MGDFQRSDPGNQRARPPAVGPFSLLIQLLLHCTARFRQRAAFDKDELLGCFQVLLFKRALVYANIVRALRQIERATTKMDPAE
jgi:hypothetical protein